MGQLKENNKRGNMKFLKLSLVAIFATGSQLFGARLGVSANRPGPELIIIPAPNLVSEEKLITSIRFEMVEMTDGATLLEPVRVWYPPDFDKSSMVPQREDLSLGDHKSNGEMLKHLVALRPNPLSFRAQFPWRSWVILA